ncbi:MULTISPECIES: hypothetical protein [Paenibacillus]|uniref:hypothetical protein n=1 Tax=Paenibacillus TaxID=44249 RepID=UPI0022B89D12|nr:hypothetical protein [Paenibacillus caseinilyticus]MCZ8523633.1 hypothetical protein [Paenibacillus caseinilyticus]
MRRESGDLPVRLRLQDPAMPVLAAASIHHATYADREVNENGSRLYLAAGRIRSPLRADIRRRV